MSTTKPSPVALWIALSTLVLDNKAINIGLMAQTTDMPWSRFRVLRRVEECDLTQVELAERMHADAPAVSVLVGDLVSRGYVERVPHPHDGRAKLVRITPAGREVMERLRNVEGEVPAPFVTLTEPERAELARLVDKMRAGAER